MTGRIRKGYVDTRDGQIHYRTMGDGHPLILLHQSPSSSAQFIHMLPFLAERGFRAISMDMPGYGASDDPPVPPTIESYAEAIQEAIRNLGYSQVDIFGHHTGASVAMMVAANYPALVRRIALWGVALLDKETADRLANEQPAQYSIEGTEIPAMMAMRRRMSTLNYTVEMAHRFLMEKLQTRHHTNWGHNAAGRENHEILAARVSQPALVICSVGDYIVYEGSKRVVTLMPNARFHDFPDATLDVPDEKPGELADVVAGFLLEESPAGEVVQSAG